jgi:signal transduction histidine kinase/ligand-binding sensor domain-containing protein
MRRRNIRRCGRDTRLVPPTMLRRSPPRSPDPRARGRTRPWQTGAVAQPERPPAASAGRARAGGCRAGWARWSPPALAIALGLALAGDAAALDPGRPLDQIARRSWPRVQQSSAVRALLPARSGYLWIGTADGLVRFDGHAMVGFDGQRLPGVVTGNIERIFEAADGALWVGSRDEGLSRIRGGHAVAVGVAGGLPASLVRAFAEPADGAVWVATFAGVVRFAPGSLRPQPLNEGLPDPRVDSIAVDAAGNVWAGTRGGLARFDPAARRWQAELGPAGAPVRVQTLLAPRDGSLLVGSFGAGVWERRGAAWRAFGPAEGLPSAQVSALLVDRDGRLWAATRDGGLAWRAGDRFSRLALALGPCDQNIEALAEDAEGGLWVATEFCGLHRLQDRPVQTLSTRDGLPMDSILGLAGAADGTVWIGTRGGGLARVAPDNARAQSLPCPADLPCSGCWDIAPAAGGAFWAVCGTNDLLHWDGRTMRRPPLPAGLDAAELVAVGADGAVWLARGPTVIRTLGGVSTPVTGQQVLRGKRVLYQGPAGTMWIAGDDGVVAWRDGKTELTRFPARDVEAQVSNLYEDREGTLWLGTKGGGLHIVRRGRAVSIGFAGGLPSAWIVQILDDDRGRLWLSSGKGMFSVPRRELLELADGKRTRVDPSVYDGDDGVLMRMSPFGHPAGWKGADGRLWFATTSGVAVLDLSAPPAPPPRVVVDEVRLGGQRLDLRPGGRPVLGPAPLDLQVQFSALSFAAPETISFRYRLDGKDTAWTEVGPVRSLQLPRLAAGPYHLIIQARQRDGFWSALGQDGGTSAALAFELRPPFYRSLWFGLSSALGLALLLALGHRLRLARERAGLHALMAERARIARDIHDTLAQAVVATSVQLECLDQALEKEDRATMHRHLDRARDMVKQSLDEARRSVWVLRPQTLERGLPAALETLVGGSTGDPVVELQVTGSPRPLSPLVEANLLRLAQEAVANAYRHARASRIDVRLTYDPRAVILSVLDDGTGLPTSDGALPRERGLAGMRERATEIGGTLSIDARPGGGTEVRAEVPR